jgi:hypothetical protein
MENLSPIAVFAFNRPIHLEKTLAALSKNIGASKSILNLFIDGPRNMADEILNRECQSIGKKFSDNFLGLTIEQSQHNRGLANSIISGINQVLKDNPRIVVVEDDLVTSPYFLDFINRGLNEYVDEKKVASIHGFVLPFARKMPKPFFLRGADCWGWGTWSDRWDLFNPDGQILLNQLQSKNLVNQFNLGGAYPFTEMLEDQIAGRNNSWAIRWHASMYLHDKLTLYPSQTYIENIGFDGSGTHTGQTSIFFSEISTERQELPNEIKESKKGFMEMSKWYTDVYFSKRTRLHKFFKNTYFKSKNLLKRIL